MLPRLMRLADSLLAAAVAERALAALEHLAATVDAGVVAASVLQQARVRAAPSRRVILDGAPPAQLHLPALDLCVNTPVADSSRCARAW